MFDASVWRIAWKEYRTQRPLWLAIVVLTLLVQFGYQIAVTIGGTNVSEQALYVMAMGAAAVYALGCGATLFATERETGTFEFQRGLPLAWRPLFVGKAGFGAASVVALAILLWGVTIAMAGGRLPSWRDSGDLWGGGLLAAWEVFAWSLLFSLLLDRPLVAAVHGCLGAVGIRPRGSARRGGIRLPQRGAPALSGDRAVASRDRLGRERGGHLAGQPLAARERINGRYRCGYIR